MEFFFSNNSRLSGWVLRNNIMSHEQHGFLSESYTTTLLCDAVFEWITEVNNGNQWMLSFFNLSQHDMAGHSKLLSELMDYGVRGQVISVIDTWGCQWSFIKRCSLQRVEGSLGACTHNFLFLILAAELPVWGLLFNPSKPLPLWRYTLNTQIHGFSSSTIIGFAA